MTKLPNRAAGPSYSAVIATCDREESLALVLGDWAAQTVKPEKVVVVEARGERQEAIGEERNFDRDNFDILQEGAATDLRSPISDLPLVELSSKERSAAKQRNLGAGEVETDWIVFCDDDVRFGSDLAARTLGFLKDHPEAVAVSPRMRGAGHPAPSRWLRQYYRLQAGFDDETYGAKLFGAGLSCYPCWEKQSSPVETNWLPSTMLWMRTDLFKRHMFPGFEGYSFGEDAHLTHRGWREAQKWGGKMYFLGEPEFEHCSVQSGVKANRFHLGKMTIPNQQRIAREAMGKTCCEVGWKSLLHRGFVTMAWWKSRRPGWVGEVAGVWRG
ncbi:MAG: glycosyltransferase [Chthoniobacterales bacterium]